MSNPDTMPTTYETKTTTQSTTTVGGGIGFHPEYLRTIPGILKIVECALALLTFICSIVWYAWTDNGGGWVQFVSMSAFISTLILFLFYLLGIYGRLPGPWNLIVLSIITFICAVAWPYWGSSAEWCQFVSMTAFLSTLILLLLHLLNLISRIPGPWLFIEFVYYCIFSVLFLIAAIVAAARGSWHSSVGATAFFAFTATAVYVVDTFFQFRAWRTGQTEMTTATTSTTTTTTTATVETGRTGY